MLGRGCGLPLFALAAPLLHLPEEVCAKEVAVADEECPAGGAACTAASAGGVEGVRKGRYLWPHARGDPQHGNSPYAFGGWPCNLSKQLAWSWHPPNGKYSNTGVLAPLFDEEKNLYIGTEDAVRKFAPDGIVLWTWEVPGWDAVKKSLRKTPALFDGRVLGFLSDATVFALSMATGVLLWSVPVHSSRSAGLDFGFSVQGEGILIGDAGPSEPQFRQNNLVWAVNATDGSFLWNFTPDSGVWNFLPSFVGDGTVVFQDWDGGAYRLRVSDGAVVWRAAGSDGSTWTDGGPALGENGVFYTVRSTAGHTGSPWGFPGGLRAFSVSDGTLLWEKEFDQTPYTYPVVGRLRSGGPLAVVTGVGSLGLLPLRLFVLMFVALGCVCGQLWPLVFCCCGCCCSQRSRSQRCRGCLKRVCLACLLGPLLCPLLGVPLLKREYKHSIQAFDAETGSLLWRYDMPPWRWFCAAGDDEGLVQRLKLKRVPICLPLASSYPTLDAQGILYVGHMDGKLYAVQDRNSDGRIDEESEVCTYDTGGSFSTPGPSIVPGMLAVTTCDSLFVFRQ